MHNHIKKLINSSLIICLTFTLTHYSAYANAVDPKPQPSAVEMSLDLIIARPLMLALTVAGTGLFMVTSPLSAAGGNFEDAKQRLVIEPFKNTFMRCLGCSGIDKSGG